MRSDSRAPEPRAVPAQMDDVAAAVRLLVVDLDGTLVSLDVAWDELRRELTDIARRGGVSPSGPGIRALMENAALPGFDAVRAEMEAALTAAEVAGAERPARNEALLEWLERPELPRKFSILSLNSRSAVERAVRATGLADRVDSVVAREDVAHGKPDPEGLSLLARRSGLGAGSALLIGDQPTDRECARRAGAHYLDVADVGLRWVR